MSKPKRHAFLFCMIFLISGTIFSQATTQDTASYFDENTRYSYQSVEHGSVADFFSGFLLSDDLNTIKEVLGRIQCK